MGVVPPTPRGVGVRNGGGSPRLLAWGWAMCAPLARDLRRDAHPPKCGVGPGRGILLFGRFFSGLTYNNART